MPGKTINLHGRGPTVGFLVDWLQTSYQWSILGGALDAARDRGASLLCFSGGVIGTAGQRDRVFDLVSPENVDALVILSGTVGSHIGPERLRAYCERFRPLPMCSVAFDLEGKKLWSAHVGKESSDRRWGSAASLILCDDVLIVNASEESNSLRAFDKRTGKQLWKSEAKLLELAYDTPALVTKGGKSDLVLAVPGEVWGLDPNRGKLRWRVETQLIGNICPSPVVDGDRVFVFGGVRSSGSCAIRAGGKGDVTASNVLWTSRNSSYVSTPLLYDSHLYWVDDRGLAWCVDANSGEVKYRQRVPGLQTGGRPVYTSPVLAGDKILAVTRWDGTLVLPAKPEFKIVAQNRFPADDTDFNATPAISNNELFLRSNLALYCVAAGK